MKAKVTYMSESDKDRYIKLSAQLAISSAILALDDMLPHIIKETQETKEVSQELFDDIVISFKEILEYYVDMNPAKAIELLEKELNERNLSLKVSFK